MSDKAPGSTLKHIYLIVEGDGEERAAPLLVRKLLYEYFNRYDFRLSVMNAKGNGNITKPSGIEKFLVLPDLVEILDLVGRSHQQVFQPAGVVALPV